MNLGSSTEGRSLRSGESTAVCSSKPLEQEDQDPQSLNCFHLERLIRIHAMLAMVAPTLEQRIQYCIDSYTFILKLFTLSFDYLHKADENKEKYANAMDGKYSEKQKRTLPSTIDDWI